MCYISDKQKIISEAATGDVLSKNCFSKFHKFDRKTPVLQSLFSKVEGSVWNLPRTERLYTMIVRGGDKPKRRYLPIWWDSLKPHQWMCPIILKTHLSKFWPSYPIDILKHVSHNKVLSPHDMFGFLKESNLNGVYVLLLLEAKIFWPPSNTVSVCSLTVFKFS